MIEKLQKPLDFKEYIEESMKEIMKQVMIEMMNGDGECDCGGEDCDCNGEDDTNQEEM